MSDLPLGLIKMKGSSACIAPERFVQLPIRRTIFHYLVKADIVGWSIWQDKYWLIINEGGGVFGRVPFARNEKWWDALTSEPEFAGIRNRPQIFVTGVA